MRLPGLSPDFSKETIKWGQADVSSIGESDQGREYRTSGSLAWGPYGQVLNAGKVASTSEPYHSVSA